MLEFVTSQNDSYVPTCKKSRQYPVIGATNKQDPQIQANLKLAWLSKKEMIIRRP